ncbi:MAG: ABC transporter substrate-binding protein [Pseudomonadota bacterium]
MAKLLRASRETFVPAARPFCRALIPALVFFSLLILFTPALAGPADSKPLTFGVLPVIQALPLFVAKEAGLFEAQGVKVELIAFRTALDKDVAMTTGNLDGYFGDLFTPLVLYAGGVDLRIAAQNFRTVQGSRMFAVVAAPGSGIKTLAELADVPVAASSNTIIDYVTHTLLQAAAIPENRIKTLEIKNIPLRLQMLLSGKVKAATLPEPLVTLAELKGGKVLADDGRSSLSSTVLVFSAAAIQNRGQEIEKFMSGYQRAVEAVNSRQPNVREIMNRSCNVPEPLWNSYPLPSFPPLSLPEKPHVQAAIDWLASQGILKSKPKYSDLVDGRFLR